MEGIGWIGRSGRLCAALACLGVVVGCATASSPAGPASGHGPANTSTATAQTPAKPHMTTAGTSTTSGLLAKPGVKHADFLTGISCASPSWCVAVGSYYYGAAGQSHTLVERWNGTDWRVQALPAGARDGALTAVSCPASTSCTAAGTPIIGWNGHSWRIERASSPFDAISCPAPSSCSAVGVTESGVPMAGSWNGRTWRVSRMPAPSPHAQTVTLSGVSCPSPGHCLAVGDFTSGAAAMPSRHYRDEILAERWNGSAWSIVPALNVARRNRLIAVSCSSARLCTAVGSTNDRATLAQWWNGARWHAERTPSFSGLGYSELTGVSCTSATRCVAVGDYNLFTAFAELYSGTTWTISHMPSQVGQQALQGLAVSCARTSCGAAGTDAGQTLAEFLNGSAWQVQATPDPR